MNKQNKRLILDIVHGRVEPRIYAFLTKDVPRFLKVGDTYRPVSIRIQEWIDKGFHIDKNACSDWDATLMPGVFFRDYEVHNYLTKVAEMERISRETLKSLPRSGESKDGERQPYSNEFFRYATDDEREATDAKCVSGNVGKAIDDIKKFYGGDPQHKLSYQIYDVREVAKGMVASKVEKKPRDIQQKTIEKFLWATSDGKCKDKKLLMYAVMRFGKTYTSLCCAKEMKAKLVVVVSAKKDVCSEWKDEVENTKNFEGYEFIDANNLKRKEDILDQIKTRAKSFVLFLTLQSFLKEKDWLAQLFKRKIDLLIVDETHFGARAPKLGRAIDEQRKNNPQSQDVDVDDDTGSKLTSQKEDEAINQISLNARIKMHLSGTPYRILMRGEFLEEDIIAFCQYTDIIAAQKEWDQDFLGKMNSETKKEYAEWDNPYYGFPQMVRFAFNPSKQAQELIKSEREKGNTCSFSEIFRTKFDANKHPTEEFVHKEIVEEFLRIFDGSDEGDDYGFVSLFKFLKENKRDICHHMVMVLPYCAACDAMAKLLKSGQYKNLEEYEVLNISGHKRDAVFDDPTEVKKRIHDLAIGIGGRPPQKTLTLTVNRMLTGSTVPEWDTMIFLKDTKSPQEYDQAIFRLQSPYVQKIVSKSGDESAGVIKKNLKPQTLLIDFNPGRMFSMQEVKGQIYIDNVGKKGHEALKKRIEEELKVSPIIFANGDKLKEADYVDVVNEVRAYSGTRGVSEEVLGLDVDLDVLMRSERLSAVIRGENELDANNGLTLKATDGEGDDFNPLGRGRTNPPPNTSTQGSVSNEGEDVDKQRKRLVSQFRNYYRRVLFYAFLIEKKVTTLQEVIDSIDRAEKDSLRIAKHLRINKIDLKELKQEMKPQILSQFEYAISRVSELAHDETKKDPVERALVAMRKFGRLGESKIVTPQSVAMDMVKLIPANEFKSILTGDEKIIGIASKMGEFALAIVRRAAELGVDIKSPKFKKSLLAIPMCGVTYEFTRKVYDLLGLDTDCIAIPEEINSYKLLEIKSANGEIDYERIKNLLTQKKSFNKIAMNDNVTSKGKHMKIAVVIGNPPYQREVAKKKSETNGQARRESIFQYFQLMADTMSWKFSSLIYPGGRWIHRSGKGMSEFGLRQIQDHRIYRVDFFPKATDEFESVAIGDGISIVYKNMQKEDFGFKHIYHRDGKEVDCVVAELPEDNLIPLNPTDAPILKKVEDFCRAKELGRVSDKVLSQKLFGVESDFVEKNPDKVKIFDHTIRPDYNEEIKLYTNDKAGKGGRAKWYVVKRTFIAVDVQKYIDEWKVVVSSANAGGQKRDWQLDVFDNHSAFGRARVALSSFATKNEAQNFYKYCQTYLIRFLFLMTDEALTSLAKKVPDLGDYTDGNGILNFAGDLNSQLYSLLKLKSSEIAYIENTIKELDKSRSDVKGE